MGGMDLGFHKSNSYKIVFANDLMKEACMTYRSNFDNPSYLHEGPLEDVMDYIPPHDVLLFGFPCQPFTIAGLGKGFSDRRALPLFTCVDILKIHQPRIFIAENVKGLITHDSGKSLKKVLSLFREAGYDVNFKLIKMENHGIPQTRHRVIFFGRRVNLDVAPELASNFLNLDIKSSKTLGEVLNEVSSSSELNTNNHNEHIATEVKQHWFKVLKEGENVSNLTNVEVAFRAKSLGLCYRQSPNTSQGYKRLRCDKIAPTMMFGNTCIPIHPTEDRSLSVREASTIQTFPLDFKIEGGIAAQYKQVGNAFPPALSSILAERILKLIK